jgi:hypothetical protein
VVRSIIKSMKSAVLTLLTCCLFHQSLVYPDTVYKDTGIKGDPPTILWREIKRELSGPNGREYFEQTIKDTVLPTLYGMLVSSTPKGHPNTFLIAMDGGSNPEVTLNLKGRSTKQLPATTSVKFTGVARAFTKEPFMLTFDVDAVDRGRYSPGKTIKSASPIY